MLMRSIRADFYRHIMSVWLSAFPNESHSLLSMTLDWRQLVRSNANESALLMHCIIWKIRSPQRVIMTSFYVWYIAKRFDQKSRLIAAIVENEHFQQIALMYHSLLVSSRIMHWTEGGDHSNLYFEYFNVKSFHPKEKLVSEKKSCIRTWLLWLEYSHNTAIS